MMRMLVIAALLMVVCTTAVHLGLPQAIGQVVMKMLKCHKCLSFWMTLVVLTLGGWGIDVAVLLSFVSAYASNWFALILIVLQKIYTKLWERISK